MSKKLFLDTNAHLPLNDKALKAYVNFNSSDAGHGNPSAMCLPGRKAAKELEKAREEIASMIGAASSNQIVFTSSCTQACEWAMDIFSKIDLGGKYNPFIITDTTREYISPTEHPAISKSFEKTFGSIKYFSFDENGIYNDTKNLGKVVCVHLQNELGTIQPIKDIKRDYLLSDMAQSLGKVPNLNVTELDVDIAVFGAHKFGGPVSVGFIYLKNPEWWREFGAGSRYFRDRAGTMDVASIVATSAALKDAINTLPERYDNMLSFRDTLESGLKELGITIMAENSERSPSTTFIRLPSSGTAMQTLLLLEEKGIYVGLGSACGSINTGPSLLMKNLGRDGSSGDFIRISQFGHYDNNDAKTFLNEFKKCL